MKTSRFQMKIKNTHAFGDQSGAVQGTMGEDKEHRFHLFALDSPSWAP